MKVALVSLLLGVVAASPYQNFPRQAEVDNTPPSSQTQSTSAGASPSVTLDPGKGDGAGIAPGGAGNLSTPASSTPSGSAPSNPEALSKPQASSNSSNPETPPKKDAGECYTPQPIPQLNGTTDITNIGMVLFPGFDPIDVFGTLESLQLLSMGAQKLNLYMVAESMEAVYSGLEGEANKLGSNFGQKVLPTNTFDDLQIKLDVLFIPGGPGSEAPDTSKIEAFIKAQLPQVKIFATVCTGARIAAKAGVLDGLAATTNKKAWDSVTEAGPNVHWVAPARFVRDGKVWSASGVTSGIDLVYSLIATYWSKESADAIMGAIEHVPRDANDDPFTEINKVKPTGNLCK